MSGSIPASATNACSRSDPKTVCASLPTCTSKAPTSIAVGSSRSLLTGVAIDGVAPYKQVPHARLHRRRERPQDVEVARQRDRAAAGDGRDGRRRTASVGGIGRLSQRDVGIRRDPQAQRRCLPAHPQHRALPARQPARLRSVAAHGRAGGFGAARPLDRRSRACAAGADRRGLRALRFRRDHAGLVEFLQRRSRFAVSRRHQGPPVHDGARIRAADVRRRARCSASPRRSRAGSRRS